MSTPTAPQHTLTLQQSADRLAIHRSTARRWLRLGLLSGRRYGRSWRISAELVERIARGDA